MSFLPKRHALFRFYGELNDFLLSPRRFTSFTHKFQLPASVKDSIESIGVPHTEVGLILLNGMPVDFSPPVRDGDRVSVYPEFRTLDTSSVLQLRPPLNEFRFVLDIHLGRLANYLRMLGFDTSYENDHDDDELARMSHNENRILLTRDTGLLKRSVVVYGYFVRMTEPKLQLAEVVRRFKLFSAASPFTRCLCCNTVLSPVAKEEVVQRLEPKTRQHYDEFRMCPVCKRIYWAGSHYEQMRKFVQSVLAL